MRHITVIASALFLSTAIAQQPATQQPSTPIPDQATQVDPIRPNYVLGPNDQILIRAPEVEEINEKPFRIDNEGQINLPLVGRVTAAGLSVRELEATLVKRLQQFVRQPQVIVTVVQFRAEPVFFVGAFRVPGIYPLQGRRTLVEMLASIGGLQPNASHRIRVTRRSESGPIPLPTAITDPEKKTSSVEISMGSLRENVNPAEDILLQPFDIISVERAELLYVNGEVGRVGGIEFGERDSISLTQALTMAGGFTRYSKRGKVRILRPVTNTARRAEIEIDAERLFDGKENDFPLMPNDVLYVPYNTKRQAWEGFGRTVIQMLPYIFFSFVR